jgi:hypothetical protein
MTISNDSIPAPDGQVMTGNERLSMVLPYWNAALVYGWICGQDERAPGMATVSIRNALEDGLKQVHRVHDEITISVSYLGWMTLLGWLTCQGLYSDDINLDDEDYGGPERNIAEFAAAVSELVYADVAGQPVYQ